MVWSPAEVGARPRPTMVRDPQVKAKTNQLLVVKVGGEGAGGNRG